MVCLKVSIFKLFYDSKLVKNSFYSTLQMRVAQFFKTMDLDYSLKLSYREFKTGVNDLIINNRFQKLEKFKSDYCYSSIEETAMQSLFTKFDSDRDGFISFDEFIKCIRMPMCQKRINRINEAFNKLDRNKDGIIDLYDVKYWYINTANSFGNLRLINDKINEVKKLKF
jgi:Ca2+-binding EF-hand superfamily protein